MPPNWKKIKIQLEKKFFPVGNLKSGNLKSGYLGYRDKNYYQPNVSTLFMDI